MNKAYLAVDRDGTETIFTTFPERIKPIWRKHIWISDGEYVILPTGTIRKLIGRDLTWEDEPVELTNEIIKKEEKCTVCGGDLFHDYDRNSHPYGHSVEFDRCTSCGEKNNVKILKPE